MTDTPQEPRTKAGRELLRQSNLSANTWTPDTGYTRDAILAIEAEATAHTHRAVVRIEEQAAAEPPKPERVRCICGVAVLKQNWENHLLTIAPRGPHAVFEPVETLTDEEARLLQRLDLLEADGDAMATRAGKILHTRLVNRLTALADRPDSA